MIVLDEQLFRRNLSVDRTEVRRDPQFCPSDTFGYECRSVYYPRLLRDGWTLIEREKWSRWNSLDIFEKPLHAGWVLRKIARAGADRPEGKGCYWDEHELIHPPSKACMKCPDWEWADLEGPRLVWASHGKLCAGRLQKDGLVKETELADFNPMTFEAIEAPY